MTKVPTRYNILDSAAVDFSKITEEAAPASSLVSSRSKGILDLVKSRATFLSDSSHRTQFLFTLHLCTWLNQIEKMVQCIYDNHNHSHSYNWLHRGRILTADHRSSYLGKIPLKQPYFGTAELKWPQTIHLFRSGMQVAISSSLFLLPIKVNQTGSYFIIFYYRAFCG